jgi:hypothetical protein
MKLALLKYMFLFDPSDTLWTTPNEFERKLTDFFASVGFEAQLVPTAGNTGEKVIQVSSMDKLSQMAKDVGSVAEAKQKPPGQVLKELSSYKGFNGRPRKNG